MTESAAATDRTELIFVRHGQSVANLERRFGGHSPTPLTELGHRQAKAAADHLAAVDDRPTVLISSDLIRAQQTADHISAALSLDIVSDSRFRERSLGHLDDMTFDEAQRDHPELWKRLVARDPQLAPPGGDTVSGAFKWVRVGVAAPLTQHRGGRVVIVSHAIAIFHAIADIVQLGEPDTARGVFFKIDNASLSAFARFGDRWLVRTVNECGHLKHI
jgi:probable phosphoglycerate mutase